MAKGSVNQGVAETSEAGVNLPETASEPGRYLCVWLDRTPEEPHMPSTGVMRWDSRPTDWWEMWPELMAHPSAYLFAPHHPNRDGPPKFADWVASWPVGFNWQERVPPQLHDHVRLVLATLAPPTPVDAVELAGATVRYAAPSGKAKSAPIDPVPEVEGMLQSLVKTLLGVSESERENVARLLSTLALAPDSNRTLGALQISLNGRSAPCNP